MNKSHHPLFHTFGYTLLAALLLLSGCTLSMEEWEETEEQVGYEEQAAVENDYFTLDYEYKETTRSLTEDILAYVAQVEDDSIIYFLDNTPSEWLPKVGGQVVANCCEKFPMGFMGRVLSVENTNGFVRVVTTEATLEDCYESFDLDFDSDIFTSDDEQQETDTLLQTRFTRSGEDGTTEIVVRDWAMFNSINKSHNGNTRSDNADEGDKSDDTDKEKDIEDIYEKDINQQQEEKTADILMFQITQDNAVGEKLKQICKVLNTIDVKLYYTTKTHIHKIVELKYKREFTETTTTSGIKLKALVGVDLLKPQTTAKKAELAKKVSGWLRKTSVYPKLTTKMNIQPFDTKDQSLVVEIPLPSVPFGLILRLKPTLEASYGVYGSAEITFWTSRCKTITDVYDGEKIRDDSYELDPPDNDYDVNAFGNFHCGGGGELFIGLGKKLGKEAAGIGAYIKMTIDIDFNYNPLAAGNFTICSADECFSLTGKGSFGGKILTAGLFGDVTFYSTEFVWLDGFVWHFNPTPELVTYTPGKVGLDANGDYTEHEISYKYTALGAYNIPWWKDYHYPILCIYETDDQDLDKPTVILRDVKSVEKVDRNTTYQFKYKEYTGKSFFAVPGVASKVCDYIYIYSDHKLGLQSDNKPNIEYYLKYDSEHKEYQYVYQSKDPITTEADSEGSTLLDKLTNHASKGTNLFTYRYALPFTLRNAGKISQYWDDWGIWNKVTFNGTNAKTSYKSLANRIKRSGKYMVENVFYSSIDTQWNPISVESALYYVPKGKTERILINNPEACEFMYQRYKMLLADKGDILLKTWIFMEKDGGKYGYPSSYKKLKNSFTP